MKHFLTVFRYELKTQLLKKAGIVAMVVMMVLALAGTSLPRIIALFDTDKQAAVEETAPETAAKIAYVFPDEATKALLAPVTGPMPLVMDLREDLVKALQEGSIEVGFVVTADLGYEAIYQDRSMYDTRDSDFAAALSRLKKEQLILSHGLTTAEFNAIENTQIKGATTVLGKNSGTTYWLSFILMLMVYMIVLLYGATVSSIIAREKDSRTMEILITSTRPSALILGKVAAAGVAAIIQFGMVVLTAYIGFQINKSTYPEMIVMMVSGTLTTSYLLTFLFFSFFGFILYLFLYAALGSTVSKMEDLGSATGLVQFLFIFGYIMASIAAQTPNSSLAVVSSIIPFSAIMVMPMRAGVITVPWGQLLPAGVLMLVFVAFFAYLSIKIYRWGSLNYGNKTKLSRIVREALRREGR
ncbi:MAG: ABC transporter permease [Clostridiales bacterium]|nr:ABC transporter permease [Clostridiales bacterium]